MAIVQCFHIVANIWYIGSRQKIGPARSIECALKTSAICITHMLRFRDMQCVSVCVWFHHALVRPESINFCTTRRGKAGTHLVHKQTNSFY